MSTSKTFSQMSLFKRFGKTSAQQGGVTAFVSKHFLYVLNSAAHEAEVTTIAIENGDWAAAFEAAAQKVDFKGSTCKVVLGGEHYQTYQIDAPKVPKQEWPVALPFLLKDVISERIADVVVDAVESPTKDKIQAYVYKRAQLDALLAACSMVHLELTQVVPDYEVWAKFESEQTNYLLLHRALSENYSVAAFSQGKSIFQRGIRGVVAPLTSSPAGGLQFDSLALEIQRSVDYLSSSFKQAHFNHLLLACDDDDLVVLGQELGSRLSVNVAPLTENWIGVAHSLLDVAARESFEINLYPEHLRPKKEMFTLTTTVVCWGVIVALLVAGYSWYNYRTTSLEKRWAVIEQQVTVLAAEQARLQQKLSQHTPTKSKLDAADRLALDIEAKKVSLEAVGQFDESQKAGFSGIMSALANIDRDDISLSSIYISAGELRFKGLARTPSSVPSWLNEFKRELSLVGRSFESLNIGRNEEGVVTFSIDSKVER